MDIKQFSVSLELGKTAFRNLLEKFSLRGINILSLFLGGYQETHGLRLLADNPEEILSLLKETGYSFTEEKILPIKLPQDSKDSSRIIKLVSELKPEFCYSLPPAGSRVRFFLGPSEHYGGRNSLVKDSLQVKDPEENPQGISICEADQFSLTLTGKTNIIGLLLIEMEKNSINILGLCLKSRDDGLNLNLVVSSPLQAEELFWNLGLSYKITKGLFADIPNNIPSISRISEFLEKNHVSLDYIYPLAGKEIEKTIITGFQNFDAALEVIKQEGLSILDLPELIKMVPPPAGEKAVKKPGKTEKQIEMEKKAEKLRIPYVDISEYSIDAETAKIIPENIARRFRLICISQTENQCTLAMADPVDIFAIDEVKMATGREVIPLLSAADDIEKAIESAYGWKEAVFKKFEAFSGVEITEKKETSDEAVVIDQPIITAVNKIILEAVERKASDIHLEPFEDELLVRFRIDGVLQPVMNLSKKIAPSLVSRIKIMSNLKIDDTRSPQDGRIHLTARGRGMDIRVSVLPHMNGESVVMRILDRSRMRMELEDLGFFGEDIVKYRELIKKPHGILLVTGPTGCGKSTTLYATLHILNRIETKAVTVEDPVEHKIKGITQVQTNPNVGLTFGSALRSFLRHDPDIIMVGEIRDKETASIAIEAALTGHLVLATLHTNDTIGSFVRLTDMGIEPFLIASTLNGVVAQRLARLICNQCKEPAPLYPQLMEVFKKYGIAEENIKLSKGRGCKACNNTGYKGRMGIYELLFISEKMKELFVAKAHSAELSKQAHKDGLKLLFEDGLNKVAHGLTTYEELCRITAD